MNPDKQRLAIAKACGWTYEEKVIAYIRPEPFKHWTTPDGEYLGLYDIPDYLNDLNAMHEAEEVLYSRGTQDNWREVDRYRQFLSEAVGEQDIFNADASTRAKCFLKILNLWTDD